MALNRRAGAAIAVVATAGLFFWLIPDRVASRPWWEQAYEGDSAALANERAARAALVRRAQLESQWRRAHAHARIVEVPVRAGLTVVSDPAIPAATRRVFEEAVRAELDAIGATVPRHPIVLRIESDTTSIVGFHYRTGIVLPATADGACGVFITVPSRQRRAPTISAWDRVLGTCAFFAAYGTPGPGMRDWLLRTRATAAEYLTPPPAIAGAPQVVAIAPWRREYELAACRAGVAAWCEELIERRGLRPLTMIESALGDSIVAAPNVAIRTNGLLAGERSVVNGGLLTALAKELGDRRFAMLWTSDEGPSTTYAALEGLPLSTWVNEHVAEHVAPYRRSALPPSATLPFTLLLGVVAIGVTFRVARRELT